MNRTKRDAGGAFLWVMVIVVLIGAGGVWLWRGRSSNATGDVAVTWSTKKEKLRISVVESGQLKAAKSTDIYCEVKGSATILYLVDEGTQVNEGDVLVRLDSNNLQNDLTAQRIKYEQANAAWIQADKTKEIQVSKNQSDIDKATVDLAIATTDLEKYKLGDYRLKLDQATSDILLAESELKNAQTKQSDTQELVALDFAAQADLDSDTLAANRADVKLKMAKLSKSVMEEFEYKRQTQLLESTVKQDAAELERVKLRCVADLAQKEADLRSKKATLDLEESRLKDLEEQLGKTVIKAPSAGLVVYPVNQGGMGMGRSDRDRVEEGATVREHQLLISLPDTKEMTVVVSVHESAIDKVRVGQPAEVSLDAIGDRSFLGKVTFIAPLPDSQNQWLNPDLKVYRCEITLGGDNSVLRPGMSAAAEIVVDELVDAIAVPVHAVKRRGDHYFVYVDAGETKIELREVKLGLHNDEHVAILDGLKEQEKVFLATPAGAPQPNFPDAEKSQKASVEELRKKTSDIAGKTSRDERSRPGDGRGDGKDGRSGRGFGGAPSAEQMEKWKNMTPEEKKKAMEDMMKNMSPEQRAQMEEARKRFGGGANGPGGGAAPAGGEKPAPKDGGN